MPSLGVILINEHIFKKRDGLVCFAWSTLWMDRLATCNLGIAYRLHEERIIQSKPTDYLSYSILPQSTSQLSRLEDYCTLVSTVLGADLKLERDLDLRARYSTGMLESNN
jgi:hypothetical protein